MQPVRFAIVVNLCLAACALFPSQTHAHETDQFTTPIGREFADLGPFFNRWAYDLIEQGVQRTNGEIRQCLAHGGDPTQLTALEAPDHLTDNVHASLPWSVDQIEAFEHQFLSSDMRQRYPGRLVSYREIDHNIYEHAFTPFDYRVFSRWFFASTIKVYGVYFGTDKIGHFTDMGIAYYWAWQQARAHGGNEEQAVAAAVRLGTEGPGSEAGWLGMMANGDYANGDLAANYLGFLFYRNITEPTFVKGSVRPPMAVRDGMYWRIADHVRRDSDFFAAFISEHLDEALNPGFFDESMRPALRQAVKSRSQALVWRYRDEKGSIRSRSYFEQKLAELSTYWGADYGHRGRSDDLVSIANCCFGNREENVLAERSSDDLDGSLSQLASARLGSVGSAARTAVRVDGDVNHKLVGSARRLPNRSNVKVLTLLTREAASGQTVTRDEFGRTALHDAASAGKIEQLQKLLVEGADANIVDDYGTTPLHLACRNGHEQAARVLLEKGAMVGAVNSAGSTPLHEAAGGGDPQLVLLLLEHGAASDARDRRGRSAADIAATRGFSLIVAALRHPANAPRNQNSSEHDVIASTK